MRLLVRSVLVAAMSFAAPSAFGDENIAVSAVSQDSSPITGPEEKASWGLLKTRNESTNWNLWRAAGERKISPGRGVRTLAGGKSASALAAPG